MTIEVGFFYPKRHQNINGCVPDINDLLFQLSQKPRTINDEHLHKVAENSHLVLAVDNNPETADWKIIGMGCLVPIWAPSGFFGRIEDVVVASEYRGQGIGQKIVEKLIEAARQDMIHVDLTSNPKREAANDLYDKLNFKILETRPRRLMLNETKEGVKDGTHDTTAADDKVGKDIQNHSQENLEK